MAASLDDLHYVAVALRVDVRSGIEKLLDAMEKGGASGGGGASPPGGGSSSGWSGRLSGALDKVAGGAMKAQSTLTGFIGVFDKVISSLGGGLTRFVQLANPATVFRFNIAVENAMSALGRIFVPILERFTVVIQKIGNAIESLSPEAKRLVGGLAAGGGLAGVLGAVATAVALLLQTFGRVPLLIGTVAAAVAGVMASTASGQSLLATLGKITKAVGTLAEVLARTLMPVVEATLVPIFESLAAVLYEASEAVRKLVNAARELIGLEAIDYDPSKKTALATRQGQIGDLRGYANRAYMSAFNSGTTNIAESHFAEAKKHTTLLGRIADSLNPTSGFGKGLGTVGGTDVSARSGFERFGRWVGGDTGASVGRFAGRWADMAAEPFVAGPRILGRMAGLLE